MTALFIAIGILLLALVLLVGIALLRSRLPIAFRPIEAYDRLTRSVGLAVENGTRLHISLGRGSLFTSRGASTLAGLAMLYRLTARTSLSDRRSRKSGAPTSGAPILPARTFMNHRPSGPSSICAGRTC